MDFYGGRIGKTFGKDLVKTKAKGPPNRPAIFIQQRFPAGISVGKKQRLVENDKNRKNNFWFLGTFLDIFRISPNLHQLHTNIKECKCK